MQESSGRGFYFFVYTLLIGLERFFTLEQMFDNNQTEGENG